MVWDTVGVSEHVHFPVKGEGERHSSIAKKKKKPNLILGQSCLFVLIAVKIEFSLPSGPAPALPDLMDEYL